MTLYSEITHENNDLRRCACADLPRVRQFFSLFLGSKPFSTGPCYRPVLNDVPFSTGQPVPVGSPVLNRGSRPVLIGTFLAVNPRSVTATPKKGHPLRARIVVSSARRRLTVQLTSWLQQAPQSFNGLRISTARGSEQGCPVQTEGPVRNIKMGL